MSYQYHKKDEWWVSPYNFIDEVREQIGLSLPIQIHDATLRDGEQTPGVVLTKDEKIKIAKGLDKVGVERIEAGMPAVSEEDEKAIKEISKLGLKSKIFTFARALEKDIDKAVECGADGVVLEIPIGYPKLKYQFNWTWETVLEKSVDIINYAKKAGLYTVYFPYDTTRAREEDIENLLTNLMKNSNPDSIGVVDTMGCALPEAIQYLVKKFKRLTNLPVEIHTHNDFGMAVATEIAGINAGAQVAHTCINGLGERTGNAALEEIITSLYMLLGIKNNYQIEQLLPLSRYMQDITGIECADNKPIVGKRNYTRESGIGVDLVVKNPLAMFATNPSIFGRTGNVVLGKKSGKLSVIYHLEKLGIKNASDEKVLQILSKVKQLGIQKKTLITIDEFKEIVEQIGL
ncbi:MAG: 2-isopropylmalate synthase [Candidatus Atribacteria bacterium]|jgi:methanogen homocitrate synthase|nr:2-isopropylmalate synthase [Candidatus Atribacteria bacterium]